MISNVPVGTVMTCPGPVMTVPLICTLAMPSGAVKFMVPLVDSLVATGVEPEGSLPRAGRPDSSTTVPAPVVGTEIIATGLSTIERVNVAVEVSPSPSVI